MLVIKTVMAVLDERGDWASIKGRVLNSEQIFVRRLLQAAAPSAVDKLDTKTVNRLRKQVQRSAFAAENMSTDATAVLCDWCIALAKYWRTAKERYGEVDANECDPLA